MRILLLSVAAMAFGFTGHSVAAPASAGAPGLFDRLDTDGDGQLRPGEVDDSQRRLFDRLLRRADSDGSGTLSADEFATGLVPQAPEKPITQANEGYRDNAATRLLLLKLDTNQDSRLTREEAPGNLKGVFDDLVDAIDDNKDGELDRRELTRNGPQIGRRGQQFARRSRLDVDQELRRLEAEQGALARRFDEPVNPATALSDPKQASQLFVMLDANGDKQLTRAELPEQLQQRVGRLLQLADANRDGSVSQREFVAASGRLSGALGRRGRAEMSMGTTPPPKRPAPGAADSASSSSTPSSSASSSSAAASMEEEGPAAAVADRLVQRTLARIDRNGDGVVTRAEARGRLRERFDAADQNGNGQIDPQEASILAELLSRRLRDAGRETAGD